MASLGSFIISAASSWANGGGRPGSGFADQVAGPSAYLRVCSSGAEHSVCDSTNALCRVVSRASSGALRRRCGDPTFRARVGNARQRAATVAAAGISGVRSVTSAFRVGP